MKGKIKSMDKNLLLTVVFVICMTIMGNFVCGFLYGKSENVYNECIDKFEIIEGIEEKIQDIDVVMAKVFIGEVTTDDINVLSSAKGSFDVIEKEIPHILDVSDSESKDVYDRFGVVMEEYTGLINSLVAADPTDLDTRKGIYSDYLASTMAVKKFAGEAKGVISKHKDDKKEILRTYSIVFPIILTFFCVLNILISFIVDKRIRKQKDQIVESKMKAQINRDKAIEISKMDIITEMKNRYALEETISQITVPKFVVGAFKIRNLEELVLTFGHDFVDSLRADIADSITRKYGDFDWYYINDDECAFVSNAVSSVRFTHNISADLNKMWTLNGVNIQLVTGVYASTFDRNVNLDYILQTLERNCVGVIPVAPAPTNMPMGI